MYVNPQNSTGSGACDVIPVKPSAPSVPAAPSAPSAIECSLLLFLCFACSCGLLLFSFVVCLLRGEWHLGACLNCIFAAAVYARYTQTHCAWAAPLEWHLGACLNCIFAAAVHARYTQKHCAKNQTVPDHATRRNVFPFLLTVPDHVMRRNVFPFLRYKDYSRINCADRHLQKLCKTLLRQDLMPPLCVPEDCRTLQEEAVQQVHEDPRLTTIVVGEGVHKLEHWWCPFPLSAMSIYLAIPSFMRIVGDPAVPKENIVVVGGIWFQEGIEGWCHLQNMTLRQARMSGVLGHSSFTMHQVIVEQCSCGVLMSGTGIVGECRNVTVRQCDGWMDRLCDILSAEYELSAQHIFDAHTPWLNFYYKVISKPQWFLFDEHTPWLNYFYYFAKLGEGWNQDENVLPSNEAYMDIDPNEFLMPDWWYFSETDY